MYNADKGRNRKKRPLPLNNYQQILYLLDFTQNLKQSQERKKMANEN